MNRSWKTTSAGIVMIVSSIVGLYFAYKNKTLDEGTVTACVTSLLGGIGLLFAKDSDKTGLPEK